MDKRMCMCVHAHTQTHKRQESPALREELDVQLRSMDAPGVQMNGTEGWVC